MTGHSTNPRRSGRGALRVLVAGALTTALLTACGTGGPEPAATSAPAMGFDAQAVKQTGFADPEALRRQADGITVSGARGLSPRAVELEVQTDAVSPDAPGGRNSVVVITPENYDPAVAYPVVYMLPGSGATDAPALQWYEAGQAEQVTGGLPVITVVLSGGQQGWYTDWADHEKTIQNWETFHLEQVVPWVDSHLSTAADRDHRLVLGNSMGGYGAVRYAEDRPDLFGEAVSLSGLLDLSSSDARQYFTEASQQSTGKTDSVFGDGSTTTDEQWQAHDPLAQSGKLKDVRVQLFAGKGNGQAGDIEPALRDTTAAFARELDSRGVKGEYTEYGAAGSCDGGHTFECWRPAATVALGRWADRLHLERSAPRPSVAPEFRDVTSGGAS
ncbi:alpha/beta hydrolase [Kocuria tytonis]|uniref:Esterase n=1 Tax=Kocuria tytonis TaxID=2054280 RepID=A0A495A109_9MICC|nr:alpha/beta hydrolase-fold protein [Kocuria tytonis]RKQ33148.1 esterase [Kocuria tytonis]